MDLSKPKNVCNRSMITREFLRLYLVPETWRFLLPVEKLPQARNFLKNQKKVSNNYYLHFLSVCGIIRPFYYLRFSMVGYHVFVVAALLFVEF